MELTRGGTFAGLARASGFTAAECRVAALSGRLPAIIRIVEQRSRSGTGTLSGFQALEQLRRRERSPARLLVELELRRGSVRGQLVRASTSLPAGCAYPTGGGGGE